MNRLLLLCLAALIGGCANPMADRVTLVTDFSFPWSDKPAPKTQCRLHTTDKSLHFIFTVEDRDIVLSRAWSGETTVNGEDRVEIFFAKADDATLKNYWCLEIDPLGRVHDYHARNYRQFDSTWNCSGLLTTARRMANGYEVCGSIPLATLSQLLDEPVGRGSKLRLGLFRAEFYGSQKATHGESADNWISWARPTSPKPDFHIPGAFRTWIVP